MTYAKLPYRGLIVLAINFSLWAAIIAAVASASPDGEALP